MVMATRISVSRGHVTSDVLDALIMFLKTFDLPCAPPSDMSVDVFLNAMQGDKKVQSGRIRYILLAALGEASIVDNVSESEIAACL